MIISKDNSSQESFDYDEAFSRNIGWLTQSEQQFLRGKRIAIAGMGGVGGVHLLTLARLGISKFSISDFDHFEIHNFNRQAGAFMSTIKQQKDLVLEHMAKDINPEIDICRFPHGINKENLDKFLQDVDLYVDGLDFFSLDIRIDIFKRCRELQIPAITAAPLGMGTAYLLFMANSMPFEQYFNFGQSSQEEKQILFFVGLNPKMANRHYLVDKNSVDFKKHKGPSTIAACQLCAGVVAAEAIKILLNRGPIYPAPRYHLFDAYLNKHTIGWLPFGNRNPLQYIKRYIVKRVVNKQTIAETYESRVLDTSGSSLLQIIDLARWAPSGDNIQPWTFRLKDNSQLSLAVEDSEQDDIYDYNAIPTKTSAGMLIETIKIAASQYYRDVDWHCVGCRDHVHEFNLTFNENRELRPDALVNCIMQRSVNRHTYQLKALPQLIKDKLQASVGDTFKLIWFESRDDRIQASKINALASYIRLKTPELYKIHAKVFDVNHAFSTTGIPLAAIGLGQLNQLLMKWAIKSPKRMQWVNALGGIMTTQFLLDYLPGILCSAHFILITKNNVLEQDQKQDIHIMAGMAMQRFWLTATQLGLVMQPSFAPLAFSYYASHQVKFTQNRNLIDDANRLQELTRSFFNNDHVLFFGRIGYAKNYSSQSRSIRKPLSQLLILENDKEMSAQ